MDKMMESMTEQRSEIVNIMGNAAFTEELEKETQWMAPGDKHLSTFEFDEEDESVENLVDLQNKLMQKPLLGDTVQVLDDKYFAQFNSVFLPEVTAPCPPSKDIEASLISDRLFVFFHAGSGYDFSAEFNHVYKGKYSSDAAVGNTRAICIRGLLTLQPSLSNELCEKYADYILSMVAWETDLSRDIGQETLFKTFPNFNSNVSRDATSHIVKVYFGRTSDDQINFWLRICMQLDADEYTEKKRVSSFLFPGKKKETTKSSIATDKMLLCYCRKHYIPSSAEAIDEFINAVNLKPETSPGVEPRPDLPPPALRSPHDISLRLLYSNTSADALEDEDAVDALTMEYNYYSQKLDSSERDVSKGRTNTSIVSSLVSTVPVTTCAELVAWGTNTSHCLGAASYLLADEDTPDQDVTEPRVISVPASLSLERVFMIACSPRHTVILSYMGNMYSCGENSEGALGLGHLHSSKEFLFVPVILSNEPKATSPAKIRKVAAGSCLLGSHSMAIDTQGLLYAWGLGSATGLSTLKPVLTPTCVDTFPVTEGERVEEGVASTGAVKLTNAAKVVDVACGGGFTVAVMQSGSVASWGLWAHGRLGLGPIPKTKPTAKGYRLKNVKNRTAKYQLRPMYISENYIGGDSKNRAMKVSCGDAHTLCLTAGGQVLSWGQNSYGQIGIGCSVSGYLHDAFNPVLVSPFSHSNVESDSTVEIMYGADVCCGTYHSLVLDTFNHVWSWGARGHPCTGHHDSALEGPWSTKLNSLFSNMTVTKTMVPFELVPWCMTWSKPRVISAMDRVVVSQLSAGDFHSGFVTNAGHMYLCGSGPSVPPYISVVSKDPKEGDEVEVDEADLPIAHIVSVPRCPSSSWLGSLCTRRTVRMASNGQHIFVLQDEEFASSNLMSPLFQRSMGRASRLKSAGTDDENPYFSNDSDANSIGSHIHSSDAKKRKAAQQERGRVDCIIISSGRISLAHRAFLAQRSPVIRDMILTETPTEEDLEFPTQLLMPEYHKDTASALIYYLYTDCLPNHIIGNISILYSLSKAAGDLKLPRLRIICERVIATLNKVTDSDEVTSLTANMVLEMPPTTLARDLGFLVGDSQFGDVRFIAEGKPILAHRFVLEQRCEYFASMFRSGMVESSHRDSDKRSMHHMVDVVVPDTFVGFLRLLIFLYTSTLPDGSDDALLEDLLTADRYDVQDMKTLCENMLMPSKTNWVNLLRLSDLLSLPRLKTEVYGFLRDNFDSLTCLALASSSSVASTDSTNSSNAAIYSELKEEFPNLFDDVLAMRFKVFPPPPSNRIITQLQTNVDVADNKSPLNGVTTIPWMAIGGLICFAFLYQLSLRFVSFGSLVPFINLFFGACVAIYVYYTLVNGGKK